MGDSPRSIGGDGKTKYEKRHRSLYSREKIKISMQEIYTIYKKLHKTYGSQGWWPLVGHSGTNPTKTGAVAGYHVGDYSFPKNRLERFEICLGAILAQNTAWPQVEKSLLQLKKIKSLSPEKILMLDGEGLKEAIKSSGYHNQKARYIINFAIFFQSLGDRVPARKELLGQIGIGPETADSMLLYAFGQNEFVVDTYTRRIFLALGIILEKDRHEDVKGICQRVLQKNIKNKDDLLVAYQEYHALLVEHAKRYYSKKPYGEDCWLIEKFRN